jgi:hypothetical protein
MKIRNGFVSNSSSSSFIVAFPKNPESIEDLSKMMHMELDKNINYYDNRAATSDVVKNVFDDISRNIKNKEATLEKIAELLSNRYYYTRHSNNMFSRCLEYGWVGKDKYYGNDEEILEELAKLFVKYDELSESHWKKEEEIINKYGMGRPKNHSELSKKEQDEWYEKYNKWRNTNKEYKDFKTKYFNEQNKIWKKQYSLRKKLSNIDAKKFMDDNKGRHICIFEYSDNDGEFYCTMEHGDIFKSLPHITVSHH